MRMSGRGRGALLFGVLAIAGCGDDGDATGNPFGTTPTGSNATTTMSGTTAPETGSATDVPAVTNVTEGVSDGVTSVTPTTGPTTGPGTNCGDGQVDDGEECDDGNQLDNDACTNACTMAVCGDGFVLAGTEACDDGNDVETDACLATCVAAKCGDGVVYEGVEGCDDGNMVDGDACSNGCALGSCGDGMVQAGEGCDDGNADNTDACTSMCQAAACGDGFVQAGIEACDELGATAGCDADCTAVLCGDGIINNAAGEECDDANMADNDACRASCKAAVCGDGVVYAGVEECDDGNQVDNDMCSNACKNTLCMPSGQRAPFNALSLDSASGCWSGNPCDNDAYSFSDSDGQSFMGFGQAIACSGAPTCVAHVGIATYSVPNLCQGSWDVLCDGVAVGTIQTLNKACAGSAMSNGCSVTFPPRNCSQIELRAANDGDNSGACCLNPTPPDSMIVGVSAW